MRGSRQISGIGPRRRGSTGPRPGAGLAGANEGVGWMQSEQFQALVAGLESMGMTRPQIADQAGLSINTIWRFGNGRVSEPTYRTVQALERLHERVISNRRPSVRGKRRG